VNEIKSIDRKGSEKAMATGRRRFISQEQKVVFADHCMIWSLPETSSGEDREDQML
jgi:hypothetical protein